MILSSNEKRALLRQQFREALAAHIRKVPQNQEHTTPMATNGDIQMSD